MGLLKMAAVGALGYVGYKYYEKSKDKSPPAFATGQEPGENRTKVRDAGPEAMADTLFRLAPERIHFISHGAALGTYAGRTLSGPVESASHLGTLRSMPGMAMGMQLSILTRPALPNDVPVPGSRSSMMRTGTPSC